MSTNNSIMIDSIMETAIQYGFSLELVREMLELVNHPEGFGRLDERIAYEIKQIELKEQIFFAEFLDEDRFFGDEE